MMNCQKMKRNERNEIKMKYTEFKKEFQKQIDRFQVFWAFSEQQFDEGMEKINCTDKSLIRAIGAGGYMLKENKQAFDKLFSDHEIREKELMQSDDEFLYSLLQYEFANHECHYTFDYQPVFDMFGLDRNDERVMKMFKEICKKEKEWQKING